MTPEFFCVWRHRGGEMYFWGAKFLKMPKMTDFWQFFSFWLGGKWGAEPPNRGGQISPCLPLKPPQIIWLSWLVTVLPIPNKTHFRNRFPMCKRKICNFVRYENLKKYEKNKSDCAPLTTTFLTYSMGMSTCLMSYVFHYIHLWHASNYIYLHVCY